MAAGVGIVIVGLGFTVTVTFAELEHPEIGAVPVTV
jgi:hypothetical protein